MSLSAGTLGALFLVGTLLPAPPAGEGRRAASGPAAGVSARFGATSPAEVEASGRSKAAPAASAPASPREHEIASLPDRLSRAAAAPSPGSNERTDRSALRPRDTAAPRTASVLAGFRAIPFSGVSPPDPIVAAGPNHVVVAVNSRWAVYTKAGALVFQSTAFGWFLPVLNRLPQGALLPYDPQVAYDQFRDRWILTYSATDTTSQSWILLSVSSSSDPTAAWYSWALPGDVNGTAAAANFSDYPALGYDDHAIYIATNQFRYSDSAFDYAKVRVLDKAALYAGATAATWFDFWDLEDPVTPGAKVHSVRPAHTFGSPGAEYLVSNSPFATRTFVTLWSLTGGGALPSLAAADIPVSATLAPPGANQKGGSPGTPGCPTPCLIDTGGGNLTSAVSRNGSLWFSHTVADTGGLYSRARYARINLAAKQVVEDEAFGASGCWYFYPAVAVDAGNNLAMVFGRTCTDAYAGVGLTSRTTADSALAPSILLEDGAGEYVVPIGNNELVNRWGDFFGAAVDPADPGRIWVVGQYADLHNSWGAWVGETAAALTAGSCLPDTSTLCLGNGRYRLTATWRSPDGAAGSGTAVPISDDTGYFWFFDAANIEVVTKVLDACGVNAHHWVFSGGLTNLETALTVTDTQTGAFRTYDNPPGTPFLPIQDTSALACP